MVLRRRQWLLSSLGNRSEGVFKLLIVTNHLFLLPQFQAYFNSRQAFLPQREQIMEPVTKHDHVKVHYCLERETADTDFLFGVPFL